MVIYEITSLIISLLVGGGWLMWLIYQERAHAQSIQKFFATFTHEVKTSLSRLRLQTESILDDFRSSQLGRPAVQLLEDMSRLEVQLENSLFIARGVDQNLFIQDIPLSRVIGALSAQFPLQVQLSKDAILRADQRVLESIFKNLMQNAVVHGGAENFWIEPKASTKPGFLHISIRNDGKTFQGDREQLGTLFIPQGPTGGSGLGLYLVKNLIKSLGGTVHFATHFDDTQNQNGFCLVLETPGELKGGKK